MNSRETLRHRNVGSGGELREPLLRQDSDADELDHGHEIEPGHCSPLGPLKKCAEFLIHLVSVFLRKTSRIHAYRYFRYMFYLYHLIYRIIPELFCVVSGHHESSSHFHLFSSLHAQACRSRRSHPSDDLPRVYSVISLHSESCSNSIYDPILRSSLQ